MARLLGMRRLEPMVDLNPSDSSANLTTLTQEKNYFQNPTFEDDCFDTGDNWSSSTPHVFALHPRRTQSSPTNNNNPTISDHNMVRKELASSDSGILISVPPHPPSSTDDASSLGGKSLDSGVCDTVQMESGMPQPDGGENAAWPARSPSKKDNLKGDEKEETLLAICLQVFIPFLIAGTGTCGAGIVLDYVEGWTVFTNVTELFILVPTLLGLKGNLEMTLASRVSTQANLGKLDSLREKWQMSWGNMALIQCQATVMGFLAAAFATAMNIAKEGSFNLSNALLLCASSLFTAVIASLVLGSITLAVVIVSHKCNINPDNVATPIAASLGDVTTLGILAAISSYLYTSKENYVPPSIIIGIFIFLIPVWVYLSYKNPFVKQVLYSGWIPVLTALVITSAGGNILEFSVSQFKGFAMFQPVINGVAGNLVAVQASRISTYFHQKSEKPGTRPPDGSSLCVSPFTSFFGKCAHARTARILMAMVIPGHLLFGYGITLIKGGDTVLTPTFLPIYLISAFIQIALLLYIAQCMIQILWRLKIDPDNSAIPLLTALGDLSGMTCLTIAFYIHRAIV